MITPIGKSTTCLSGNKLSYGCEVWKLLFPLIPLAIEYHPSIEIRTRSLLQREKNYKSGSENRRLEEETKNIQLQLNPKQLINSPIITTPTYIITPLTVQ